MKKSKDAFGIGLRAFMAGGSEDEMLQREDGQLYYVNNGEYFIPYDKWERHEKQAIKYAKGRVLDIGCGAGRHAIYLQEKGIDVLGIDNSPIAIEISKERGLKKAKVVSMEAMSPKLGTFETILMLGNNFGLFQTPAKMKKILTVMDKMTPADGIIIAESMDPYRVKSSEQIEYQKFNVKKGRLPGYVRMRILIKDTIGPWFDYVFVTKKEMLKMFENTPWRVKKFYGGMWPSYAAIIEKRKK